jgi:predicted transcriptional regulator
MNDEGKVKVVIGDECTDNDPNNYQRAMDIFSRFFLLLNHDPRIKIVRLLMEHNSNNHISFRTIARRCGINYRRLREYLSELESSGLIESVKLVVNNKRYSYYRLNNDAKEFLAKLLHDINANNRHYMLIPILNAICFLGSISLLCF